MAVKHTNTAGTAPGEVAPDGGTYTGSGYLTGGTGSDQITVNNNSTMNGWVQLITGNDSFLMDSGGVVNQFVQGQTYANETAIYEIYNSSVPGMTPRMTEIKGYLNTGGSKDTVTIDGSGYRGSDQYAISIGADDTEPTAVFAGGEDDTLTMVNNVHIAGHVDLGEGSDSLTLGDNIIVEGNIGTAGGDSSDDSVSIGEGATVTGSLFMTNGDDTLTIAGNLGDGVGTDRIDGGEGANDINTASTANVNLTQITMGSTTGSLLSIESGANVTLTKGTLTGAGVILTQGNDAVFLGGTINSNYDMDVSDSHVSDDTFTFGGDFSAANEGANNVFKVNGGGNSIATDNDTLNLGALLPRIFEHNPDPTNAEHGTITLNDGTVIEYFEIENVVTCFTRGTRIITAAGNRMIEDLRVGDLILTRDNGLQPIRWIGSRKMSEAELEANANLRPIRIRAGALSPNTPAADLIVSPQHRILVRSKIVRRMFCTDEVLVGAKHLQEIDGVEIAEDIRDVEYFHLLFDGHEIIISNGTETESLHTGEQALKSLSPTAREEIFSLFPELREQTPETMRPAARPLISGRMGRQLTKRHCKNGHAFA